MSSSVSFFAVMTRTQKRNIQKNLRHKYGLLDTISNNELERKYMEAIRKHPSHDTCLNAIEEISRDLGKSTSSSSSSTTVATTPPPTMPTSNVSNNADGSISAHLSLSLTMSTTHGIQASPVVTPQIQPAESPSSKPYPAVVCWNAMFDILKVALEPEVYELLT